MRYVFGPQFQAPTLPQPLLPSKADPIPEFLGVEGTAARYRIPPYDTADHNVLAEIRVYLIASGSEPFGDAPSLVASPLPFGLAKVADDRAGALAVIPLPDVPPGEYFGQTVYGYED